MDGHETTLGIDPHKVDSDILDAKSKRVSTDVVQRCGCVDMLELVTDQEILLAKILPQVAAILVATSKAGHGVYRCGVYGRHEATQNAPFCLTQRTLHVGAVHLVY